jgi:Tol biopolymer transport system component
VKLEWPRTRRRSAALGCAAFALALASAGPAAADSIVYIGDGDVWLVSPDGEKQHQVTSDGGYSSPTQSDDGKIVAVKGGAIYVMDQNGDLLATPAKPKPPAVKAAVSPDGETIAYQFSERDSSNRPHDFVGYRSGDGGESSYDQFSGFASDPSWVDNGRAMATTAGKVNTQRLGTDSSTWWDDVDQYEGFGEPCPRRSATAR